MCRNFTWKSVLLSACLLAGLWVANAAASGSQPEAPGEETMLMFVGETQPVVTVASRFPESPTTAPAMVTLVSREEIERSGYRTLAELLNDQNGFYLASGGRGTVPYLRGLRDSVLFLYDGVPITTDVTKSFAALDQEISLLAVERLEIVRGAGSVLWGADAFAGVVNIVPRRGRQKPGVQGRLIAGSLAHTGAGVSWSANQRNWDSFLALSASRERFHDDNFMASTVDSGTAADLDSSHYTELVGTLNVGDWLHLSGRWSGFDRRYTMQNGFGNIRWAGSKDAPVQFLKATVSKVIGPSHYSLTGFYQTTDYQVLDADIERRQRNRVSHLELLWDRRVLSRGLMTFGASWRRNAVDDAVVRDGFLPDFLAPDEDLFVPRIEQGDFSNQLASLFGQFRYQWGKGELWAGLRLDDHSQYKSTLSYSFGFLRPLSEHLHFKAAYGTAFRSPYSSQLFDNQQLESESVKTASAQLLWKDDARSLELTLFHSQLQDHRAEDPYGGLSLPSNRELYGAELTAHAPLSSSLRLNAGLSLLRGSHGLERYRVLAFSFVRPDGSKVDIFDQWQEPIDQGPSWLARFALLWSPLAGHDLTLGGRFGGDYDYSYEKGRVTGSYRYPLLIDAAYRCPGLFSGKDSFTLRVTNLLDRDYQQADLYGPVAGPPLQATLLWQYNF